MKGDKTLVESCEDLRKAWDELIKELMEALKPCLELLIKLLKKGDTK